MPRDVLVDEFEVLTEGSPALQPTAGLPPRDPREDLRPEALVEADVLGVESVTTAVGDELLVQTGPPVDALIKPAVEPTEYAPETIPAFDPTQDPILVPIDVPVTYDDGSDTVGPETDYDHDDPSGIEPDPDQGP
jgi:hypothetical protein